MRTLDLHGLKHHQIERAVENFVLLEDLPVKIITGNSLTMRSLVSEVLETHKLSWDYESDYNLGAIVVTDTI
jgi:hypothetical protein